MDDSTKSKICFYCCKTPTENIAYTISLIFFVLSGILTISFIIFMAGIPFGFDIDIYMTHIPLTLLLIIAAGYSGIVFW